MVKKSGKKESSSSKSLERLIESNIVLQHKMTDILLGIKDLNENVSALVHLFKSAGESIKSGKYEDPRLNRLNELLEQNKNLTRALMLLEKYVKDKQIASPLATTASEPY